MKLIFDLFFSYTSYLKYYHKFKNLNKYEYSDNYPNISIIK